MLILRDQTKFIFFYSFHMTVAIFLPALLTKFGACLNIVKCYLKVNKKLQMIGLQNTVRSQHLVFLNFFFNMIFFYKISLQQKGLLYIFLIIIIFTYLFVIGKSCANQTMFKFSLFYHLNLKLKSSRSKPVTFGLLNNQLFMLVSFCFR